jgi:hypothetical protein
VVVVAGLWAAFVYFFPRRKTMAVARSRLKQIAVAPPFKAIYSDRRVRQAELDPRQIVRPNLNKKDRLAMRAVAPLIFVLQICTSVPSARANVQAKAEDCSAALSGTTIASKIEIHCLGKEDIARVIDELVSQGVVRRAEDVGIETSVIVSLAARLRPTQKLDFAQAVVEVSHAVDIAVKVVTEGASGSGDQLVDEALKRIAERTKANDPLGATREAEEGFARWEKEETERRASALTKGVALLEAALKTDLLRFDAASAAGRVEKIASLQHEADPNAFFEALRARQDQFYVEGSDNGVNFSLDVAIAIARLEVARAHGPDEHGGALNDLGLALWRLGERESGRGSSKKRSRPIARR